MGRSTRSIVAFLLLTFLVGPTAALASPDQEGSGGTDRPPARAVVRGPTTTKWTFSTRDAGFTGSAQGWWSSTERSTRSNRNYIVGRCCHSGGSFRNYFTFDLSTLTGTVVLATLVLRRYSGKGGPTETYRLQDVVTDPTTLNETDGRDLDIWNDLGQGRRYGAFELPTDDPPLGLDKLALNDRALADIQAAQGGHFSVGGRLLTVEDGGFLFGGSYQAGRQELIVITAP